MNKYNIVLSFFVSMMLLAGCMEKELTPPSGVEIVDSEVSAGDPYHIQGQGFKEGDVIFFESKDARYRFQSVVDAPNVSSSGVDVFLPKEFIYEVEYYVYLVRGVERVALGNAVFHRGSLFLEDGMDYCGLVTDLEGNPVPGVTVSDGYSCTVTDEKGIWQLKSCEYSYQISVSIPENYKVPIENGLPCFWHNISSTQYRYDFRLEPLEQVEKEFYLFCLADPQCKNQGRNVKLFAEETIPDIKAMTSTLSASAPVYGITLGDIGYNDSDTDHNSNNGIYASMKEAMSVGNTGIPIFQVMGNHDNIPVNPGDYSVSTDISGQRNFEKAFGPVNYSFNRGDVHIVAMDNILMTTLGNYSRGFRDDQIEWLRQDLSNVSRDKMLILCLHIPLGDYSDANTREVISLIESFRSCHVMSGHTHYSNNVIYPNRYEHTHAAVCGAWWWSTINTDGSPNGYAVYKIDGAEITHWQYKGVGMDLSDQIRMYRADLSYMSGYTPAYKFSIDTPGYIWANIWNWDSDWKVEVYEDGVFSGNMTRQTTGVRRDAWAVGYHMGVVGRTSSGYDKTNVSHLFYYCLKNPASKVEIRATDGFGNVYVQDSFTDNTRSCWPLASIDEGRY